jgi:hypothetical protein
MAKAVRVVRGDAYEEMGAAYQCVLTAALDAALRENGIRSPATRRKIAESFVFAVGEFHDTGWLRPAEGAAPMYQLRVRGRPKVRACALWQALAHNLTRIAALRRAG